MRGRSLFPRKIQLALVLATFVATGTFGVFGAARKAAAQPAVAPAQGVQAGLEAKDTVETTVQTSMKATDLSQGGTRTGLAVKEEAKATWRVALQNTAAIALLNGLNYFAQKVAYDAAVYVAAGGKGQVPLIFDSPGRYFKSVGADAAGEILGSLTANSDFLKKYGINLCAPTNPRGVCALVFSSGRSGTWHSSGRARLGPWRLCMQRPNRRVPRDCQPTGLSPH